MFAAIAALRENGYYTSLFAKTAASTTKTKNKNKMNVDDIC